MYTSKVTVRESSQGQDVGTNMDYAGQALNLDDTLVSCDQLSWNFRIREGNVERIFQGGNKLKLRNETTDTVIVEKVSLIAYAIPADEATITKNNHKCGRK